MVKIVGILNITPDSFSDGGKFNSANSAIKQTQKLIKDGADIIDIGAESTRPGSKPISADEEWSRLEKILPEVITKIKKHPQVQSSIDSYHFKNIVRAYDLGIDIINDVSGLADDKIIEFIAEKNITTILMHNLAIHFDPTIIVNQNLNINREIIRWTRKKLAYLEKKGVKKSQLIFDPGVGFAKNGRQSLNILKNISDYRVLNLPIYVGHSKKSFLKALNIDKNNAEKTLEISKFLIEKGIDFLRVHDVLEHKNLIKN